MGAVVVKYPDLVETLVLDGWRDCEAPPPCFVFPSLLQTLRMRGWGNRSADWGSQTAWPESLTIDHLYKTKWWEFEPM